jgi:hypothetical protein
VQVCACRESDGRVEAMRWQELLLNRARLVVDVWLEGSQAGCEWTKHFVKVESEIVKDGHEQSVGRRL